MAGISGYDSASLGVLFSSLNQSSARGGSSRSGASDLLGINYSDYATIRNGSYSKLLSAYYSKPGMAEKFDEAKASTSTSKDDAKKLARIESAADTAEASAAKLTEKGKNSVWKKVTTTGEDGASGTDYDRDAVYKAVRQFAEDYNTLLDQAGSAETKSIARAARTMENYTKANERMLAKAGITIGADGHLSVDEKDFAKADLDTAKDLFTTRGSYGTKMEAQMLLIESYAKNEAAKANTYGKSGSYTYNYNTGELYNTGV